MTLEGLRLDVAEGLARLTYNDPGRGNPSDGPLCASLCEAAIQLSGHREVRRLLVAERAMVVASQLAAGPTRAFGEIRRLLLSAEDQPLEAQLELEAQALARIATTADAKNALLAFAHKRKPVFTGC